jgi:hypothetical protein
MATVHLKHFSLKFAFFSVAILAAKLRRHDFFPMKKSAAEREA